MPPSSCGRRRRDRSGRDAFEMSPGATFDRVYVALREQLAEARFHPGDPLEPAALGDELHSSITPVRDALHRLAGERLVDAPRHDGFRVPALAELELRDLYGWNLQLLELAVRRRKGAAPDQAVISYSSRWAAPEAFLFAALAREAGNAEHLAAVEQINDRLSPLRCVEKLVLGEDVQEIARIESARATTDWAGLRKALRDYHRRRFRHVPQIILAARQRSDPS